MIALMFRSKNEMKKKYILSFDVCVPLINHFSPVVTHFAYRNKQTEFNTEYTEH